MAESCRLSRYRLMELLERFRHLLVGEYRVYFVGSK